MRCRSIRHFTLALLVAASGFLLPTPSSGVGGDKPDIIFVLLDDLSADMLGELDRFRTELQDRGTMLENFILSTPMCCPSRTNFLLGDFSHNHGVWEVKNSPYGGYHAFKIQGHEENVVAKALQQDHGYQTALMGKFFNWYPHDGIPCMPMMPNNPPGCGISSDGWRYVPPYWSTWRGFRGGAPSMFQYFGTDLLACDDCVAGPNGGTAIVTGPAVYNTDYLREEAVSFIEDPAQDGKPLFLWLAPVTPHKDGQVSDGNSGRPVPPLRYEDDFASATWPEKPNLFEQDLSDKPTWLQNLTPLDPAIARPKMDAYFRDALRALEAVEDLLFGIEAGISGGGTPGVLDALEAEGRLENAYIFVASDNGYHYGEHGLPDGKRTFFEEDIRIPLLIRGPGVPAGVSRDHLVGNIDLARTFLEIAGGNASVDLDGRSLVPLLRPAAPPTSNWRQAMLLERLWSGSVAPGDSFGIRTASHKLMTYPGPEEQLYDLSADPFELQSQHGLATQADRKLALTATLDDLKICDGPTCRNRDSRPSEGKGRTFVAALFDPCIATTQGPCTTTIVWDARFIEKARLIIRNRFGGTFRCRNAGDVGYADAGPWGFGPSHLEVYDTDAACGSAPPKSDHIQSLTIGKAIEANPRPTGQIVTLPSPCVDDGSGRCEASIFVKTANLDPAVNDRVEVRLPSGTRWRSWPINSIHMDITGNWQTSENGRELSLYPGKAGQPSCVEAVGANITCDPANPATNLGPRLDFTDMYRQP